MSTVSKPSIDTAVSRAIDSIARALHVEPGRISMLSVRGAAPTEVEMRGIDSDGRAFTVSREFEYEPAGDETITISAASASSFVHWSPEC